MIVKWEEKVSDYHINDMIWGWGHWFWSLSGRVHLEVNANSDSEIRALKTYLKNDLVVSSDVTSPLLFLICSSSGAVNWRVRENKEEDDLSKIYKHDNTSHLQY